MNQSNSKVGSCTMTLIGEHEGIKKIDLRMLSKLLNLLEDSRMDVGRF